MVPLLDLLWPLLLAAGAMFLCSGLLRMVALRRAEVHLPEATIAGIRQLVVGPGEYALPVANGNTGLRGDTTYRLTVVPGATIASRLEGRFAYHVAINILIAYLAGLALLPGTDFGSVLRFTTSVAFLAYGSASLHGWLSERRPWRLVWRPALAALASSLVVGAIFAALWPL